MYSHKLLRRSTRLVKEKRETLFWFLCHHRCQLCCSLLLPSIRVSSFFQVITKKRIMGTLEKNNNLALFFWGGERCSQDAPSSDGTPQRGKNSLASM